MVEVISVIGIMILIIVSLFFGKILSILGRVLFAALFIALIIVLVFGVSMDQVLETMRSIILAAF